MLTAVPSPSPYLNSLVPGGRFRQYQLLEQIGAGGQAVVWSALDGSKGRIYAIKFNKILEADQTGSEEIGIEHKFDKLVHLRHAHILPFEEHGSEERVRFTVSPYIPGGTLATRIKTAPLSFEEVLKYGVEIASALDYLHSQGVIHRDLKTSNILLDLGNHTYLADFGLARLISTSTLAFHTGHGTPPYAPPEQIRSKEITPRSDIFSFGILLFEMFTGQLPWNGQRQLGVEQLHSEEEELPALQEYVPRLPPRVTDVLRRATSANPDLRPRSATDVMRMIYYIFNVPFEPVQDKIPPDQSVARDKDAEEILRHALAHWQSTNGQFNLGLTKFALIDLHCTNINTDIFNRFMLSQALTYGHHDHQWWSKVSSPRERLLVSYVVLRKENEAIVARVLRHLTRDTEILSSTKGLPENVATSLLAIGTRTKDSSLRQKIFAGLRSLVRHSSTWHDPSLDPDLLKRLGELALEYSEAGDTTAELIGHLRTPSAVKVILRHPNEARKIDALLLVQEVAGSLPSFVSRGIRFRLTLESILQILTQQPLNLIGGYMMSFLGAALGVGVQVYLTYNLPNFLDIARTTTSLEQGLIIGSIFGLGIFLPRVMTERLQISNALLRLFLGTLSGLLVLNIALLIFHLLFLSTPPKGMLITLGCALIALAFAISGLIRFRLIKMLLSSASIFTAILGTWWLHVNLAASQVELTPLFKYDYSWSWIQVVLIVFFVAAIMGILGNLVGLSLEENHS